MSQSYSTFPGGDLPSIDVEIPQVGTPYDSLTPTRLGRDPVEVAIEFKRGVEKLPETVTVFPASRVLDEDIVAFTSDMAEFAMSWEAPTWTRGNNGNGTRMFVNPNSPDAWMHSDVFTVCECGATVMTLANHSKGEESFPGRTEHGNCRRIDRWRARYRMIERQRLAAVKMLRLGHTSDEIGKRLGRRNPYSSDMVPELGVDITEEKRNGREKIALTAVDALTRMLPEEFGELFDLQGGTINEYVNEYTDTSAWDLYVERRNRGIQK